MFFYVSLFIACVISAFLVLYLYHALADLGSAVYNSLLPSSKGNATSHIGSVRSGSTAYDTQTPWGWQGSGHETRRQRPRSATPSGASASGLDGFLNNAGIETTSVGWPYREEKVGPAGKTYKVTRKPASKKPLLRTGYVQPWGW